MSRIRMTYALAFLGILITTGGCSSSATAPEAASVGRAGISQSSTAKNDSVAGKPADDGDVTVQSGYIFVGGN